MSSGEITKTVQFENETSPFNSLRTHLIKSNYLVNFERFWNRLSSLSILSRSS